MLLRSRSISSFTVMSCEDGEGNDCAVRRVAFLEEMLVVQHLIMPH
jgi:hypothetical protein